MLISCSLCLIQAQNSEAVPLKEILNTLEKEYAITFNYAEKNIDNISIAVPKSALSLTELLAYLKSKTALNFTLLNDTIVLIEPKSISFCGYLKDELNQPLAAAHIYTKGAYTTSDANGYFKITLPKNSQTIRISFLGFKTLSLKKQELDLSDCTNWKLQTNYQNLSEVVISNFITSGINKLTDGSYEIDFSNFTTLPGLIENDVLQSVQAFPGISSANETVSNINIRGGTHDQNLILWDGIKMYQSGHFFGLISMFNPLITQRVNLIKNGSTASLSDGVSGTISMETERDINKNFKGVVGSNLTDAHLFLDTPIGSKSSLQIAARHSINGLLTTPTYTEYFDRIAQNTEVFQNTTSTTNTDQTFNFYDTSLRWLYHFSENDKLRVNFLFVDNNLTFNENATIDAVSQSRESQLSQNSLGVAVVYDRQWNKNFSSTFEAYETRYNLKAINANIIDDQRFLQENKVSETSLKLKNFIHVSAQLNLIAGYHFTETGITNLDDVDNPLFRLLVTEVVRSHALFSEFNYNSKNHQTLLNIGLRANYIEKFNQTLIEPRLSFNQRLWDHFNLEILGELKHQTTSQVINFQNDFLGIEKRRWQLANNEDIPVMQSQQLSLGLSYQKNGWLLSADSYYKFVDNITTQSQGFQNQYEFVRSIGNYEVIGLDVLLRKQWSQLSTWLSYTFMDNNYSFETLESDPFPSNYNITHAATLGMNYNYDNFNISAGANWYTGRPISIPIPGNEIVNNEVNFGNTNAENLEDYLRLDLSANYTFKLNSGVKAELGVSVWNILNKVNDLNRFYRSNDNTLNQTIQQSLGLTPNAVLNIRF